MIPIRDNVRAYRTPFVTWLLILANLAVFWHELAIPPPAMELFFRTWGVVPARFTGLAPAPPAPGSAAVTLLTSMFVHGGWLHLIGNMWALWLFGDNVEDRLGHGRYLVFYVLCGIAAMAAHILLNPASTAPTVGASGAVAGVMGAYFLFFPTARIVVLVPIFFFFPLFVEVPAALFLLLWLWSQAAGGLSSLDTAGDAGGIAFWAHVGGFVAGFIFALVSYLSVSPGTRRRWERETRFRQFAR